MVTWQSNAQDGDSYGIYGQRFDNSNNPVGTEFQVNTTTAGRQEYAKVTALADGGFVVAWQDPGQDGNSMGVFGQKYNLDPHAQKTLIEKMNLFEMSTEY